MRKPRLSKKTVNELYTIGKAYSGKYEYDLVTEFDEKCKAYKDYLYRWDMEDDYKYEKWEVPAEGIWAYEK